MIKEDQLLDYLDGTLSKQATAEVEQHLNNNPDLKEKLEQMRLLHDWMQADTTLPTSDALDQKFQHFLAQEKTTASRTKIRSLHTTFRKEWAIAAGFLLLASLAIGVLLLNNQQYKSDLSMVQHQLEENQKIIMNLLSEESASGRIRAVNLTIAQPQNASTATFQVLADVINKDENLNVRLAAIEALQQFSEIEEVRTLLVDALKNQEEPITQIALIQALVQLEEERIVPHLQELINHPILEQPVKDEAYNGLLQMGAQI
ncbi:MAG: HEAT repeat domain-containing protein [Bacteroidota bacterium]